jgi:ABC-2 type transport system permease protein
MMRLRYELRLLLRSRVSAAALLLLLALSLVAVWAGLSASARQNAVIDRVAAAQGRDLAAIAKQYGKPDSEAGYAAYYTFHLTSDRPSSLAFAAMGQRDIQPYVLRVRLLGLQAQLYETETVNPELALPGPFDFAFVLIYLAPLAVIVLMHDLVSGEWEAGRLRVLSALPTRPDLLWLQRAGLRLGLVLAALLAPFLIGAIVARAPAADVAALGLVAFLYVTFWTGLGLLVGAWGRRSAFNAATLVGCWIVLVLLVPALGNAVLSRAVPVGRGVDLTLAQREAVHHAWDVPREAVMDPFVAKHPEWSGTPPVGVRFHWKWYYAMHEMGDDSVAGQVAAYRGSLAAGLAVAGRRRPEHGPSYRRQRPSSPSGLPGQRHGVASAPAGFLLSLHLQRTPLPARGLRSPAGLCAAKSIRISAGRSAAGALGSDSERLGWSGDERTPDNGVSWRVG